MGEKALELAASLPTIILTIFSSAVLMAVSVIISGKLLAKRFRLGFSQTDKFGFNIIVMRVEALGDEASLGFIIFILALLFTIVFGGRPLHEFFVAQTGLSITQWNSLCFSASVLSIVASLLTFIGAPFFQPSPLISQQERQEQISALREKNEEGA